MQRQDGKIEVRDFIFSECTCSLQSGFCSHKHKGQIVDAILSFLGFSCSLLVLTFLNYCMIYEV